MNSSDMIFGQVRPSCRRKQSAAEISNSYGRLV